MALGSLVVSLGLSIAEFTSGMEKSEYLVRKFGAQLDKQIATGAKAAGVALASMGASAVAAYVAFDRLAKAAGSFKDIEERTGASAESLAAFAPSAAVAGTSVEEVANAMNKFAKGLAVTDDETKDLGAGLAALGLNLDQIKQLSPDEQIREVAKAFNSFGEGASKGAVAMAIFGRSGAQLLPFFKELATEGERFTKLTQQQIERADEFADKQARARAELEQTAQALAVELLPTLTSVIKAVKDFIGALAGVNGEANKLDTTKIKDWAETAVLGFSKIIDVGDGVIRVVTGVGKVFGAQLAIANTTGSIAERIAATKSIIADVTKDLDNLAQRPFFSQKVAGQFSAADAEAKLRAQEDRGFTPKKPQLQFSGKVKDTSAADSLAKTLFEGQIKALEQLIAREKELLSARESFLQDSFNDGYIGIKDYYDSVNAVRGEALAQTIEAYDKELAAAAEYRKKLSKESDVAAQDNKIADIQEKREKAIRDAGYEQEKFDRERSRANAQWAQELVELTAKTLELRGETAKANALRFDSQNAQLRRKLGANGDTEGLANLDFITAVGNKQDILNSKTRDYQLLLNQLGDTQSRIAILTSAGFANELQGLAALSKANRDSLGALSKSLAEAEDAANSLVSTLGPDNPLAKAALQNVEQLKLKYLELATTGDLVARKFNDVFANNLASGLEKLVTGTGTIKERLTAFINDLGAGITKDLTAIFAKNLSQSAFGQGGPLSFLGDFFSQTLGLGTKATSDQALVLAGNTLTTAGSDLLAAATQLSYAAASMGGGSGSGGVGSLLGSLFSGLFGGGISSGGGGWTGGWEMSGPQFGFAAGGTDYWRGGDLMVGENGPELLRRVPAGARVVPNHKLKSGGGGTVVINQTIPPNVDTRSVRQATLAGVHNAQSAWSRR